jgi:cell division protein FtsQ
MDARSLPAPGAGALGPAGRALGSGLRSAARLARAGSPRARRFVVGAMALLLALGGGYLWARDSSLVRVEHVTVSGVAGAEAPRVTAALRGAARTMTTLHVRRGALLSAVASYPTVAGVRVQTDFPHGLRIFVERREPVAALSVDGRRVAVAVDGTLLRDASTPASAPALVVAALPAGARVSGGAAGAVLATIAAAPRAIRAHVSRVWLGPHGLEADVRQGPAVYFGPARRLHAKWIAADRVLSDPGAAGARYIDVRVPERAVAGGLPIVSAQTSTSP